MTTQEKLSRGQQPVAGYNPFNGMPLNAPATPDCWRGANAHAWVFNPWTGRTRDTRDMVSDPHGLAIWAASWGPLRAAAQGSTAEAEGRKLGERIGLLKSRDVAFDPVQKAEHYNQGGVECIEAIRAALTPEEFRGFCKGNALKYVWRERNKGGDESLRKAEYYLNRLVQP